MGLGVAEVANLFSDEVDIVQSPVNLLVQQDTHFIVPTNSAESQKAADFPQTQGYDGPWEPQWPTVCSGPLAAGYAFEHERDTALFARLSLHATFFRRALFDDVEPFLCPTSPELADLVLSDWPANVYPDDFFLQMKLKLKAGALAASPARFYCYRSNENSAVRSPDLRAKSVLAEINLLTVLPQYLEFSLRECTDLARATFGSISAMVMVDSDSIWRRKLNQAFFDKDSPLNIERTELGKALGIKFQFKCWLVKFRLFKVCLKIFGGRLMAIDAKISEASS